MDAQKIIETLGLVPLDIEGGYFRETYRCEEHIHKDALHNRYGDHRNIKTAIYYLLTPDTFSAIHRVKSDEIFHFYMGDTVEMLHIKEDGAHVVKLGTDLLNGEVPQYIVPYGTWQGARLADGGSYALMGTTVAPGFEYDDFELADCDELSRLHPDYRHEIRRLCKQ